MATTKKDMAVMTQPQVPRNIQQEIQDNLDAIEKKYNVRILLAVESGSRAWGFASPDSDYDVRFIYVHEAMKYIRVDAMKDVIEWKLDEVLDINGWDLSKALSAFGKSNPNIMEWANSPIIYRKSAEWDTIREVAFSCFSEKASLCHYYGIANTTYRTYLRGDQIMYKKYFYALRPLLCCRYIERYHQIPPMEFSLLMKQFDGKDPVLNQNLKKAIKELLDRKAMTDEGELNPQMPAIINFIKEECERQKQLSSTATDDRMRDYAVLNKLFRQILGFEL